VFKGAPLDIGIYIFCSNLKERVGVKYLIFQTNVYIRPLKKGSDMPLNSRRVLQKRKLCLGLETI